MWSLSNRLSYSMIQVCVVCGVQEVNYKIIVYTVAQLLLSAGII